MVRRAALAPLLLLLVWPSGARAEIRLPPGFSAHVYVTGEGFDPSASRAGPGIPAVSTLSFSDGDAPRGLGVAPVTPDTRRLGIASDLFVVMVRREAGPVAEIVRISGPLEELVRSPAP